MDIPMQANVHRYVVHTTMTQRAQHDISLHCRAGCWHGSLNPFRSRISCKERTVLVKLTCYWTKTNSAIRLPVSRHVYSTGTNSNWSLNRHLSEWL